MESFKPLVFPFYDIRQSPGVSFRKFQLVCSKYKRDLVPSLSQLLSFGFQVAQADPDTLGQNDAGSARRRDGPTLLHPVGFSKAVWDKGTIITQAHRKAAQELLDRLLETGELSLALGSKAKKKRQYSSAAHAEEGQVNDVNKVTQAALPGSVRPTQKRKAAQVASTRIRDQAWQDRIFLGGDMSEGDTDSEADADEDVGEDANRSGKGVYVPPGENEEEEEEGGFEEGVARVEAEGAGGEQVERVEDGSEGERMAGDARRVSAGMEAKRYGIGRQDSVETEQYEGAGPDPSPISGKTSSGNHAAGKDDQPPAKKRRQAAAVGNSSRLGEDADDLPAQGKRSSIASLVSNVERKLEVALKGEKKAVKKAAAAKSRATAAEARAAAAEARAAEAEARAAAFAAEADARSLAHVCAEADIHEACEAVASLQTELRDYQQAAEAAGAAAVKEAMENTWSAALAAIMDASLSLPLPAGRAQAMRETLGIWSAVGGLASLGQAAHREGQPNN